MRPTFAVAVLLLVSIGRLCATTVENFHHDGGGHPDLRDLSGLELSSPSELRFVFANRVASYWAVDTMSSYLRYQAVQVLAVETRKSARNEQRYLFASPSTGRPFKPGRYSYHLVIKRVPSDGKADFIVSIETGWFDVRP